MNTFSSYGNQLSNALNEQIGVSINIPVFNRGRTKSNIAQSKIALQQAELSHKQNVSDARQAIIQDYRDVLTAMARFEATVVKHNAYWQSFEAYQTKFKASTITTVDLLQQQNNYTNTLSEYIQSKYSFLLKRMILDVYMGEFIGQLF